MLLANRRSWLRRKTKRRVLVQTADGSSIEGLLAVSAPDGLVLTAARIIPENGDGVRLVGETFIPRGRVLLVQLLPPDYLSER